MWCFAPHTKSVKNLGRSLLESDARHGKGLANSRQCPKSTGSSPMTTPNTFPFFQGNSLSDLFAQDIHDAHYALLLNYPATASWAAYPNVQKYYLQDGSSESTKTSFDKICQKEPWKNLAVLGEKLPGIVISPPQKLLMQYWQEHFGFGNIPAELMDCSNYLDELSGSDRIDHLITLFPFDHL